MIKAVIDWYILLPQPVQAAMLTAGATIIAASIAAKMITVQLRGQAEIRLDQHEELTRYFREKTPWAVVAKDARERAAAAVAARDGA